MTTDNPPDPDRGGWATALSGDISLHGTRYMCKWIGLRKQLRCACGYPKRYSLNYGLWMCDTPSGQPGHNIAIRLEEE